MSFTLNADLIRLRTDAALLLATATDDDTHDAARRLVYLLERLASLGRCDVYYNESGCDCCSGDYERIPDTHGAYVEADDVVSALREAAEW